MKILLEPILVSIVAGLFIFAIPNKFRKLAEIFSLFTALYLFVAGIKIFFASPLNAGYLYVDNLSRFIVPGIGFFGFLITLYSLKSMSGYKSVSSYYAYIIWTIGVSILAAVSNNIIIFLVSWGFLGFLLYALINMKGPEANAISKKTFIIIAGSDAFMIIGFSMLWMITGYLNLTDIKIPIDSNLSFWSFFLIAIGAFAKAGVMPFHTWIPETASQAPVSVTAFLPASLDKLLGIYLLMRLVLNIFVLNTFSYSILMVIGSITIIAAVMMALIQHDFKKLLGYHAVSQVGYMVLGIGTGNPIGIAGGLFHMLNHAIYKCCLFLSGGNVEYKTKTAELDNLGGLSKIMPLTFFTTVVAACAISGIPPFNGFFSKWMIYQGLVENGKSGGILWVFCLAAAMFGSGLTLASFIKLIHAIFLGQEAGHRSSLAPECKIRCARDRQVIGNRSRDEVSWQMWVPVITLAILCIVFGVFAYQIPLKFFIGPVLGAGFEFIGKWQSLKATLFLFAGLVIGLIIYLLGNFKSVRVSDSYIGGEPLEKDMRLSGTEFYNTVKEYGVLGFIYKKAEAGFFDLYEQVKKMVLGLGGFFQYLHNGILPTYLVWTLLGMMGLFLFFMR
ncbi:MAG: proton-conducting transporter membrane subunit [Candidatus Omnitrophica bacterium]|nr:proton-conducting transporter membrane subunit [Candidatus Omnitrophota bacterium]